MTREAAGSLIVALGVTAFLAHGILGNPPGSSTPAPVATRAPISAAAKAERRRLVAVIQSGNSEACMNARNTLFAIEKASMPPPRDEHTAIVGRLIFNQQYTCER
jgi:hypothetical protein